MTANESTPGLLLNGLDGSNPLGFLAAVGTLRTATQAGCVSWELKWEKQDEQWSPVLLGDEASTADNLLELLMPTLKAMQDAPALSFGKNLNVDPEKFRTVAKDAQARATFADHRDADFIAAFGCESLSTSDDKTIQDTALRTMSGAGHQHFLGSMRTLAEKTTAEHLRAALFQPWQYTDKKFSMRWDPIDDRRYALRWEDPSAAPTQTVWGANRLAVEALPLFPTAPVGPQLHTTGFSQRRGKDVFMWPIWVVPLSLDIVRSLLSLDELQKSLPDRNRLLAMGVAEIYCSQRFTKGKFRNFAPAHPV